MSAQQFGGKWTAIKLKKLKDYIDAYMRVMKHQRFKLTYIDAFCGSGETETKEEISAGASPLIALEYGFDKYVFIDKKKKNIKALQSIIGQNQAFSGKNIEYYSEDANTGINRILSSVTTFERGIIFLDPFAMSVSYDMLKQIAATERFDVWYLFPLNALNRCLKTDGKINPTWANKITYVLGTEEWEQELYKTSPQMSLFEETDGPAKVRDHVLRVLDYSQKRLSVIFPGVCSKPAIFRNSKNSPLFALFFMCSNPSPAAKSTALRIAESILK